MKKFNIQFFAEKNIKLKDGGTTLYPQTKADLLINNDGTKFNPLSKQEFNNAKDILEVTELPKNGWAGTTVPNTGHVDKVYFNTKLDKEYVLDKINKLAYIQLDESTKLYNIIEAEDANTSHICYAIMNINGAIQISDLETAQLIFSYNMPDNADGWHNIENIAINKNVVATSGVIDGEVGKQNDLISDLVSITPFVESKPREDIIYKLKTKVYAKENRFLGTPIPNRGTLDKVYFNTDKTVDDVLTILDKLPFKTIGENNDLLGYTIAAENTGTVAGGNGIGIWKILSKNRFVIFYLEKVTKPEKIIPIFSNQAGELLDATFEIGWNVGNELAVSFSNLAHKLDDVSVGSYNGLLIDIISATPFKQQEGVSHTGTPVPNTGQVEKVYFNTNLSIDAVKDLVKPLMIDYDADFYVLLKTELPDPLVYVISTNQETHDLIIIKLGATGPEEVIFSSIVFPEMGITEAGWNKNLINPININKNVISNLEGTPIGIQNDLLSGLFSTTPFVKQIDTKYSYWRYIDNNFEEVINSKKEIKNQLTAINNDLTIIKKEQEEQNYQIAKMNNILYETVAVEAEEDFPGEGFDVPQTIEIDGAPRTVLDNQLFKVSGVKGLSRKSKNKINIADQTVTFLEVKIVIKDGVFTFSGTGNDIAERVIQRNISLPAGTYTLSANNAKNSNNLYPLFSLKSPSKNASIVLPQKSNFVTATKELPAADDYVLTTVIVKNVNYDGIVAKLMLSTDGTTEFEKGIKSSTIKNVESWSPNLFDYDNPKFVAINNYSLNFKPLLENRHIFSGGKYGDTSGAYLYIPINSNKFYTQFITNKGDTEDCSFQAIGVDNVVNEIASEGYEKQSFQLIKGQNSKTITFSKPFKYVGIAWASETYHDVQIDNLIIAKEKAPYQPYGVMDTTLSVNETLKGAGTASDELVITENANGLFDVKKVIRMAEVDMGTLEWYFDGGVLLYSSSISNFIAKPQPNIKGNGISTIYPVVSKNNVGALPKQMAFNTNGNILVYDMQYNNDIPAFINLVQGQKLIYELDTPTEEVIATNLTRDQISVLTKQGGNIKVNNINEDDIVKPKTISMSFDVKYGRTN